jgi:hypothetical protein
MMQDFHLLREAAVQAFEAISPPLLVRDVK